MNTETQRPDELAAELGSAVDVRAYVSRAEGGWKRWKCLSQHAPTEFHRSRAAAMRDACARVAGDSPGPTIRKGGNGTTVIESVGHPTNRMNDHRMTI
jgi:hypothetical protein